MKHAFSLDTLKHSLKADPKAFELQSIPFVSSELTIKRISSRSEKMKSVNRRGTRAKLPAIRESLRQSVFPLYSSRMQHDLSEDYAASS